LKCWAGQGERKAFVGANGRVREQRAQRVAVRRIDDIEKHARIDPLHPETPRDCSRELRAIQK
jgi:hypothetical protein